MLLDEDPAALIAQCTKNFKSDPDHSSLLRISDSLTTLSQFRTHHLDSLQSTLSKLSRTHQTLSSTHALTLSQHNPTNHASEILRLDTEKFRIAKQASDLEIEGERLAAELGRLGGVLGELEEEGVEGGAERERMATGNAGENEDATVLKLKVYRTLGIDVEADTTTGQYNKAVIRNAAKGDVHVVNIDPKFSRHFYTNYFWRTM
ncbi:kinetochore protein-like protein spc24 [Clohesyomyces aquaticus]|uniref:Kinetochore protein Spc24 n=1 Tax=Clohesyomyces aquaticus TaxID=1231657 RepID=A0A1Y1ZBP5_9PLEO|nr:kinetochore protein-like protein spc24 [Clohesyomyces aquaticus]